MSEIKSIIEIVKRKNIVTGADSHIARITGERSVPKPHYYRNIENGQEYSHIAGGIGWPEERPGFIVVVAVEKQHGTFRVLEEAERSSIDGLLSDCLELRQKYGYNRASDLFRFWYGEQEKFDTFVAGFNHKLKLEDEKVGGIYLSPPHDYQKPNAFEIWSNRIQSCLGNASKKKTLYLGNCNGLRNHIQNFPHDGAAKGSIENYPAIACLGGVIHSLMMLRPWLKFAKREKVVSTMKNDYVGYAGQVHEEAMRNLGAGYVDYGDMDEYEDRGEVVPTIPDDDK
jgi:hypothetical protein